MAKTRTRRDLLITAAIAGLSAAGAGLLYSFGRLASAASSRRRYLRVARASELVPGTWRLLSDEPIYIVVTGAGVAALSARCTHLGCTVRRRGDGFVCACHGSRFDLSGRALSPPARDPLGWLEVSVSRGTVYVDPTRNVPIGSFLSLGAERG